MRNIHKTRKITRLVKYLFLLLGIIVLSLIFVTYFKQKPQTEEEKNNSSKIPENYQLFSLKIDNSVFEGLDKNNLPYKILAKTVTKEQENLYKLNSIDANYQTHNGNLIILAEKGVLNESNKNFSLDKNIKITLDDLEILADKIDLDLNTSSAVSKTPVIVNFQNTSTKASSFNTEDKYNIINFQGNVVSSLLTQNNKTNNNADDEITITSDQLRIDNNKHFADYTKQVTVFFEDIILKTDKLKIYYSLDNGKETITKIYMPVRLKAIRTNNNQVIIADSGEYIVATNELTLMGNIAMKYKENMVVTDKLVYVTKYKGYK